jgi:hypothetical protein
MPHGGVVDFQDSLVTKQLADLLKVENQSTHTGSKAAEPVSLKPLSPRGMRVSSHSSRGKPLLRSAPFSLKESIICVVAERKRQMVSVNKAFDSEINQCNQWMKETTEIVSDVVVYRSL